MLFTRFFLPVLLICCCGVSPLLAQSSLSQRWQSSNNGLYGGDILELYAQGSAVFASVQYNKPFRSLDNGSTWEALQGLPSNAAYFVAFSGTKIGNISLLFASTDRGLFRSEDNGNKWQAVNSGLPTYKDPNDGEQRFYRGHLFASTALLGNSLLFITSGNGVYRSQDNGATWQESSSGLPKSESLAYCAGIGDVLLTGTSSSGIFGSTDQGRTWSAMNSGLEYIPEGAKEPIQQRAIYRLSSGEGETALVSILLSENIYRWDKTQKRWELCSYNSFSASFARLRNTIIMGNYDMNISESENGFMIESKGVARSADDGRTMQYSNNGLKMEYTSRGSSTVAASEETGNIFAGTPLGVFRSTDGGITWSPSHNGMNGVELRDMHFDAERNILLATAGDNRIFRSTNRGNSWEAVFTNSAANRADGGAIAPASTIIQHNNSYFAAEANFIRRSDDYGTTWKTLKSGWISPRSPNAEVLMSRGSVLLAGTSEGLIRSLDNGTTWQQGQGFVKNSFSNWIPCMAQNNRYVFAVQHLSINGGGIYRSQDDGARWERIATGGSNGLPANTHFSALLASGDTVWVSMNEKGIFRSLDNGSTWQAVNQGLPPKFTAVYRSKALTLLNGTLYFCCQSPSGEKVFRSQNGGESWERFDAGLPDIGWAAGVVDDGSTIFLGASSGFYRLQNATTAVRNTATETATILAAPNPLRGDGHITYHLTQTAHVRISLVNVLGQTVEVIHDAAQSEGEHSLPIESTRYSSGVYSLQLEIGAELIRYAMVISK